jgi:CRISP-associated protein Cas1
MPSLFLTTPGARVSLISERLRVEWPPEAEDENGKLRPSRDIPLHELERVVLEERVHITTPALAECLRRAIPIVIVGRYANKVLGTALPPGGGAASRIMQYKRSLDEAFALAIASTLVEAKIANSRRVLQRLAANRPQHDCQTALNAMEAARRGALSARSLDSLRGYEGTAAGSYFEAYGAFFPEAMPFERRSRRPPLNAPNAILSFAYTILCAETECLLHASGLDPAIGFLHETEDGRPSLALDLLECFRAPVADALALDLISHGILKPDEHFEKRDGGVFLNSEGRKKFYLGYERRMEREYTSEQLGRRTTLRGEILRQIHSLKRSIATSDVFEPFLMN